jgi:FAD/FMN-containing dehydrogenase
MSTRHLQLPAVDGLLRVDEASRAGAADDFGHIVHRSPHAVLLPASAHDVAAAVRWAAGQGLRFAAQGRRHSVFGRSQVADGVVADMTRLRTVHAVEGDRVVIDAGATWHEVLAATLPRGLVPPVLPDYLDLTVGGTLAVGGVGAMTSRFGVVSDNVLDLQVVTGRAELVTCSSNRDADLFDAVRAGLGQVGVITRATLALVPAPRAVRRTPISYPDLATMLAAQRRLAEDDRFAAVQGAVLPSTTGRWTFQLDAVAEDPGPPDADTVPYLDYLDRLALLERALRGNGQWSFPHPWLMTFVGDAHVEEVVGAELARLTPADLGPFGQVALSAFRRPPAATPLLRLPPDELCYAFNLVRIPATDDPAEVDRLLSANRAVYERVRAGGGVAYPVSALSMSRGDWRAHYGSAFDAFSRAKRRYDPDSVLTPGYDVF